MQDYLDSLRMLKEYDLKTIAPGHGDLLQDPHSVAEWIIKHRLEREKKVIQAIKEKLKKRKKELNSLSFPNGLPALSNLPGNQIVEDSISRLVLPSPYKKEHIHAIRMA